MGQGAIWCGRHGEDDRHDGDDAASAAWPERADGAADAAIGAALARAAADPGLDDEIGAVRVTLRRVLRDGEADPLKAALAVARLAAVAVQAARTRQTLADAGAHPLQGVVQRAAALLEAEAEPGANVGRDDEPSAGGADAVGAGSAGAGGAGVDLRSGHAADGGGIAG